MPNTLIKGKNSFSVIYAVKVSFMKKRISNIADFRQIHFGSLIVHCVTDYYAHLSFCCKPGLSSKFRPILDTQVPLADFHGDEAKNNLKKKSKMAVFQNCHFSKSPILKIFL
jgi:hypothetical protein